MSIIAAHLTMGGCFIGSDTGLSDNGLRVSVGLKWASRQGWHIGACGDYLSFLVAQGVLDGTAPAGALAIARRLREALQAEGFERTKDLDGGPFCVESEFLLTNGRGLWSFGRDFAPVAVEPFAAAGSGRDFALGAMSASRECGKDDQEVIRAGLDWATRLSFDCGAEWRLQLVDAKDG
ncbi:MAG: hypothetical protein K0S42_120 [Microvirga sp.]|nr:hypothetical protein [Microvirga sp.]